MKIAIAGTGYVGLSIAVLLAQHHEVVALDIVPAKVDQINRRESPIEDAEIERFLRDKPLNLRATLDPQDAYRGADFVVIASPTTMREGCRLSYSALPSRKNSGEKMRLSQWYCSRALAVKPTGTVDLITITALGSMAMTLRITASTLPVLK